jgi:hypothetical protein
LPLDELPKVLFIGRRLAPMLADILTVKNGQRFKGGLFSLEAFPASAAAASPPNESYNHPNQKISSRDGNPNSLSTHRYLPLEETGPFPETKSPLLFEEEAITLLRY